MVCCDAYEYASGPYGADRFRYRKSRSYHCHQTKDPKGKTIDDQAKALKQLQPQTPPSTLTFNQAELQAQQAAISNYKATHTHVGLTNTRQPYVSTLWHPKLGPFFGPKIWTVLGHRRGANIRL